MDKRFSDIKLVVIDIDGTLVDTSGRVGGKTLSLARELKQYGVYCTLSSARSFHYSAHIAEELEVEKPFVTLDGALIKDLKNNIVYKGVISRNIIDKSVLLAEANYGKITMCDEENLFITPRNLVIKEYTRLSAPVKEITSFDEVSGILEILIYCEDKSSLHAIREGLKFPRTFGVAMAVTKSPRNEYYLLTVKKRGSDKLRSVKRLVRYLKLRRNNIAVIGDWHNDMPLFDYGGYNIAVKNAIPELKRKADYITTCTNNEDAVGEVLEILYDYKKKNGS